MNFANSPRDWDSATREPELFEGLTIGAWIAVTKVKNCLEDRTQ
jgi:hypothetical protein